MIRNKFIYATLATVLFCVAIDSPADAVRWENLHQDEQRLCTRIHAHVEEVTAAVEDVCRSVQSMAAAGRQYQTKLPAVRASVGNLRALWGRVRHERPENINGLPNISRQGNQFMVDLALTLEKFDALFNSAHEPREVFPRLAVFAGDANQIKASFQNVLQVLPPHPSRDQVCTALLIGFQPEGQDAEAAAYGPLFGGHFWAGMPHARPAGAAAAHNYNAAGDDEEDDRYPAAEAAPRALEVGPQDEEGVYLDSILGDEAAFKAYFDASEEERARILAGKLREVARDAQAGIVRRDREAEQRRRLAGAVPGHPARAYTPEEHRQVAECIAQQKRAKGNGKSSGAEMVAAVLRAMPHLHEREVDDLLFARGIYLIRDAHEPAARLFAALAGLGMGADALYPIMATQSVADAQRDLRYGYPDRATIIECIGLLRASPYQLDVARLRKIIGVMVELEEEEHDRY